MQKHPDADAFMRSYLEHPADAVSRLVFADWLQETGEPHNAAWANFIRLRIEADRYPPDSAARRAGDREADTYAPRIRANLTIPAALFAGYPKSLLQLLPAPNITVRLADFAVPHPVLELVPESVARENLVLPLGAQERTLLLAAVNPHDADLARKLEFILNLDIVLVRAARDDVLDAINRAYGPTETESVASGSYESPLIGLQGDPASGALFGIFHTAFSSTATGFTMEVNTRGCLVRYYAGETQLTEELFDAVVYDRLLEHLLAERSNSDYAHDDYTCADLDVPLLSGRRFPVTLERCIGDRDARRFRLRFRW